MDKLAQIKIAETRGVVAALIDAGIVKIADENVFGAVTDTIATQLSENYDMDEMLAKTADVLEAAEDLLAAKENLEAAIAEEAAEDVDEEAAVAEAMAGEEEEEELSDEDLAVLEELAKEASENGSDFVKTAMIAPTSLFFRKKPVRCLMKNSLSRLVGL